MKIEGSIKDTISCDKQLFSNSTLCLRDSKDGSNHPGQKFADEKITRMLKKSKSKIPRPDSFFAHLRSPEG